MNDDKLHPLTLTAEQIELRDVALQQIDELRQTLARLDGVTGTQADREVIADIRSNLANDVELFSKWFGTSPTEE
jgi:hypothetical protein